MEAFVIPRLGPDIILHFNSIMRAFQAILDWDAETTTFTNTTKGKKIPATHRKPPNTELPHVSSVVTIEPANGPIAVRHVSTIRVPGSSEMAIRVQRVTPPTNDALTCSGKTSYHHSPGHDKTPHL